MKSDHIKRSVRATQHVREPGDAPNLGRIARMPGVGRPKGIRRRRKVVGKEHRSRRSGRAVIGARWSLLLGMLAVILLGIALGVWLVPKMNHSGQTAGMSSKQTLEKRRVISKFPSPSEADAIEIVKSALVVREPAEIPEHFRPGGSSVEEIVAFLSTLEAERGPVSAFEWLSSLDSNGLALEGVTMVFDVEERGKQRLTAFLTPDVSGRWRIDYEALVQKATPSWADFQEGKSETIEVRVVAAKDNYYNGFFRDESQWECYGIVVSGVDENLYGYCRSGTPQAEAMKWILSRQQNLQRAMIGLRREKEAGPRQFEINKVLADDWVMGDAPFDETFNW